MADILYFYADDDSPPSACKCRTWAERILGEFSALVQSDVYKILQFIENDILHSSLYGTNLLTHARNFLWSAHHTRDVISGMVENNQSEIFTLAIWKLEIDTVQYLKVLFIV